MIRYAQGVLTVRGRKLSTLVLTGAVAALVLAGCSGGSSGNPGNPKDASPSKQDTALQPPPDLGTGGTGGGMGGAGGAGGMDASPDRAPIGGADSGVDAVPADRPPANLDVSASEAGAADGPLPNPDGSAVEAGGADGSSPKDGLASDAGAPDAPSPNDGLAPEAGGTPPDGGGGEAGSGTCPSPVHAWAYPVGNFAAVAWDRDGSLVTPSSFYFTTTSFGGLPVTNAGSADMLVAKLDPATGNATWVFTAGDANDQFANQAQVTSGNLAVIGTFTGTLDIDPVNGVIPPIINPGTTPVDFIVGLNDADGTGVWSKKVDLGGGQLFAMAGNPSKDYFLVCGAATKNPATLAASGTLGGGKDVIVAAIKASDGTVVWAKLFGGAMDQVCYTAALDDSGNAYFAGTYAGTLDFGLGALTPAPTGANDQIAWVAKLSGADGTTVATKTFGTSGVVQPVAMALDPQGGVIVAGNFGNTASLGGQAFGGQTLAAGGKEDAFVAKLNSSTLDPLWARGMGGSSSTAVAGCQAAAVDSAGNITVVGNFKTSLNVGPGDASLQAATPAVQETFVVTLDGTTDGTLCAHRYGDPSSAGNGASAIAISRGANKDRAAIGGYFTKVIDFGPPTTALSAGVNTARATTAYLLEM